MKQLKMLIVASLLIWITGCSQNTLYFSTYSSLGLDSSGTAEVPNHVSLAYSRFEGAYVPPKHDSKVKSHSLFGGIDADVGFFPWQDRIINQTFATGRAASQAAKNGDGKGGEVESSGSENEQEAQEEEEGASLLFTTSTLFGLELRGGDTRVRPRLTLGYRRGEAAYIPISDLSTEVRSVYSDISINSMDASEADKSSDDHTRTGGVRIKQKFATGKAAVNLVSNEEVKTKLREAAGIEAAAEKLIAEEHKKTAIILNYVAGDGNKVDPEKWNCLIKGTALEGEEMDEPESVESKREELLNEFASFLDQLVNNIPEGDC